MGLDGIRMRQQAHLTDRCTVTRGTYPDHVNVAVGVPCQVRASSSRANREVDVAQGETITLPVYELRVPYTTDIARGDVISVTASIDPQFTGRWLTAVEVTADSLVATRVVTCREQQT